MAIAPGSAGRAGRSGDPKSPAQILQELWELIRAYAKQETIDPLRNLGRFLGWGLLGSASISLGVFLIGLGLLRLMQRSQWLQEHSYVSYVLIILYLIVVAGLLMARISAAQRRAKQAREANARPTGEVTA